ncbi:MAG TPA: hypothetical protein VFW85_08015 [Gaiellaceae bacterium]|nr:hypothetical protein [Gaiellaceae bacterium]
MKKHLKLLSLAACVAAVATLGASGGAATAASHTSTAYVCLPGDWLTPEAIPSTNKAVFPRWDSFATGAWTPWAETSVKTGATAGKYYLTCTAWEGWTQVGTYVLGDGTLTPPTGTNPYLNSVTFLPNPGVYPILQPNS